jgi:hypothetical protein
MITVVEGVVDMAVIAAAAEEGMAVTVVVEDMAAVGEGMVVVEDAAAMMMGVAEVVVPVADMVEEVTVAGVAVSSFN